MIGRRRSSAPLDRGRYRHMKFALHFGNFAFPDPEGARRLVRLAEAAAFDSVFAVEHVVFPDNYTSVYPYAPGGRLPGGPSMKFPDPLIWLTWVAAATTRLRFMTAVMILPQRNPLVLAKEVATLDHLSGGRIELGIGVGWLKEEFEALGIPFERRGKRADEYIAAMRALWASDGASFAGEFVKFDKVSCNPKPVAKSVPIVVGGHLYRSPPQRILKVRLASRQPSATNWRLFNPRWPDLILAVA